MAVRNLPRSLVVLSSLALFAASLHAQAAPPPDAPVPASSSSANNQQGDGSTLTVTVPAKRPRAIPTAAGQYWKHPGVGLVLGVNGPGIELAEPISERFNLRVGGEFIRYTGTFQEEGANVSAELVLGGGHAGIDFFPFYNGFRITPQIRFAIQTQIEGAVIVPPGQTISLDGGDYVSSNTDPLRGSAFMDTRKWAPGISIGYGNLSPRNGAHWSFPVDIGFYYIGQPNLNVFFTGSACDPSYPQPLGCQGVNADPQFQADLQRFITRQNHNLSYASFFPIASFGVGYRF